jgi:hypothetical protein
MSGGRLKSIILVGLIVGAALILWGWGQSWFVFRVSLPSSSEDSLSVTGQQVAPALSAYGLTVLALVAALSLAQRVVRIVLFAGAILIGSAALIATFSVISSRVSSSLQVFIKLTGNASLDATTTLIASSTVSVFPFVAVVGSVVVIAASLLGIFRGKAWPRSRSRKFDATTTPIESSSTDPSAYRNVDSWDQLSRGTDPTIQ